MTQPRINYIFKKGDLESIRLPVTLFGKYCTRELLLLWVLDDFGVVAGVVEPAGCFADAFLGQVSDGGLIFGIVVVAILEELDDVEEQQTVTTHLYNVTHNSDFYSLMNEANITDKVILNFTNDTYDDFYLTTINPYVELWGNGVTLKGDGTHDIFTVTNADYIVIKDFIINVNNDV